MPINQAQLNKYLRSITRKFKAGGDEAIPMTKPELLAVTNAVLSIWEAATYKTAVSDAIEVAFPGLSNARKKHIHEGVMEIAVEEDLL